MYLRECFGAGLASEAVFVPPGLLGHDPLDHVRLLPADRAILVHLHRRRCYLLQKEENNVKSNLCTIMGIRNKQE